MNLPRHISLTIEHNPHAVYHEDVWTFLQSHSPDWESAEKQPRAEESNEFWTMQWFPDTPIGSIYLAAPTLEELLAFAEKIEKEDEE